MQPQVVLFRQTDGHCVRQTANAQLNGGGVGNQVGDIVADLPINFRGTVIPGQDEGGLR